MSETINIQIKFNEYIPEIGQEYVDAIYIPYADYIANTILNQGVAIPTDLEDYDFTKEYRELIDTEKSTRITNHVDRIKNPPVVEEVELTEEDIQAQLNSIEQQKQELDIKRAELTNVISEKIAIREELELEARLEEVKIGREDLIVGK